MMFQSLYIHNINTKCVSLNFLAFGQTPKTIQNILPNDPHSKGIATSGFIRTISLANIFLLGAILSKMWHRVPFFVGIVPDGITMKADIACWCVHVVSHCESTNSDRHCLSLKKHGLVQITRYIDNKVSSRKRKPGGPIGFH